MSSFRFSIWTSAWESRAGKERDVYHSPGEGVRVQHCRVFNH